MCKHSWNTFDRAPFTLAPIISPDLQYHPIPTAFPQRCASLDNWNAAVDDMSRATRPTCQTTWQVPEAAPVPPWLLRATHTDAHIVVVLKMQAGQWHAGPPTSVLVKSQRSSIDLLVRVTYCSNLPPWEEKAQGVGFYGGSAVQVVNAPGLFYSL